MGGRNGGGRLRRGRHGPGLGWGLRAGPGQCSRALQGARMGGTASRAQNGDPGGEFWDGGPFLENEGSLGCQEEAEAWGEGCRVHMPPPREHVRRPLRQGLGEPQYLKAEQRRRGLGPGEELSEGGCTSGRCIQSVVSGLMGGWDSVTRGCWRPGPNSPQFSFCVNQTGGPFANSFPAVGVAEAWPTRSLCPWRWKGPAGQRLGRGARARTQGALHPSCCRQRLCGPQPLLSVPTVFELSFNQERGILL